MSSSYLEGSSRSKGEFLLRDFAHGNKARTIRSPVFPTTRVRFPISLLFFQNLFGDETTLSGKRRTSPSLVAHVFTEKSEKFPKLQAIHGFTIFIVYYRSLGGLFFHFISLFMISVARAFTPSPTI